MNHVRSAINAKHPVAALAIACFPSTTALKAMEVWRERPCDEIHLVLTDLLMPGGMSGRDLGETAVAGESQS